MNRFLPFTLLVLALAVLLPAVAQAQSDASLAPASSCAAPALFAAPAPNVSPNAPIEPAKGAADWGDLFDARIDEAGCFCGGIVCQGQFCWCQCVGDGRCCSSCCRS